MRHKNLGLTPDLLTFVAAIIEHLEKLDDIKRPAGAGSFTLGAGEISVCFDDEVIGAVVDRDGWWEYEPITND